VCGVFEFDVNDHGSIARAISAAGPIDALVSNAGAGLMGALEGVSLSVARVSFSG
jgi:NADP-dependent 3-hydroxy acid dehydrogenase YdfG